MIGNLPLQSYVGPAHCRVGLITRPKSLGNHRGIAGGLITRPYRFFSWIITAPSYRADHPLVLDDSPAARHAIVCGDIAAMPLSAATSPPRHARVGLITRPKSLSNHRGIAGGLITRPYRFFSWIITAPSYRADHPLVLDDSPAVRHAIGCRAIPAMPL